MIEQKSTFQEKDASEGNRVKVLLDRQRELTAHLGPGSSEKHSGIKKLFETGVLEPFALSPSFVHNLTFSDAVPEHIAAVITTALKQQPESSLSLKPLSDSIIPEDNDGVFQEPELSETATFEEKLAHRLKILEAIINHSDLKEERFVTEQVHTLLRNTYGIDTTLSTKAVKEVYEKLTEANHNTLLVTYYATILERAQNELSKLAPHLASVFKHCAESIILAKKAHVFPITRATPLSSPLQATTDTAEQLEDDEYSWFRNRNQYWGQFSTRSGSFMRVDDSSMDIDNILENRIEHTIIMGHELIHATSCYLMGHLVNTDQSLTSNYYHAPASLHLVIEEGIALAFEAKLSQHLLNTSTSEEDIHQVETWQKLRHENLTRAARVWKLSFRALFMGEDEVVPPGTEDFPELAYSEGAKLALILERNGWELNDLPLLCRQLKQVINEELGSSNLPNVLRVPLTKETEMGWLFKPKTSRYLRVRKRIRQLKPLTAA